MRNGKGNQEGHTQESPYAKRRLKRQASLGQSFRDQSDSDDEAGVAKREEERARKRRRFRSGVQAQEEESPCEELEGSVEAQEETEEGSDDDDGESDSSEKRQEETRKLRAVEADLTRKLFAMRSAVSPGVEEESDHDDGSHPYHGVAPPPSSRAPGLPRLKSSNFDTSSIEGSGDDSDDDSEDSFFVPDDDEGEEMRPTPIQVDGPISMEAAPHWRETIPSHWPVWFRQEVRSTPSEEEAAAEVARCIVGRGKLRHTNGSTSPLEKVCATRVDYDKDFWGGLTTPVLTAPHGPHRRSVLHGLALRDCADTVRNILWELRGACVSITPARLRDRYGLTPLHLAAMNPTFDGKGIRDLLNLFAPNLQFEMDKEYRSNALQLALFRPDVVVAATLLAGVKGSDRRRLLKSRAFAERRSAVLIAAAERSVEKLTMLRPADYKEIDGQGNTALHLAAGSPAAVRYLVKYGVCGFNCVVKDTGVTPLHMAAVEGSALGVAQLIELGADAHMCDTSGWPPLLYALQCVESEDAGADAVEVLLRHDTAQPGFPQLSVIKDLLKKDPNRTRPRVARLMRFVCERPPFFKMLNDFLRPRLELLLPGQPLAFILRARSVEPFAAALDMENKMRLLTLSVSQARPSFVPVMKFKCLRGPYFLQETVKRVLTFDSSQMRWGNLSVSWCNERGSCLGPEREMWTCIFDELPDFAFERSDDGRLLLPRRDVDLEVFVGIGRLLAMALLHHIGMRLPLHRSVVEALKKADPFEPPSMEKLWEWLNVWSPTFHNSMKYLQDNDLTGLEEELCLSCGEDNKEEYILCRLTEKVHRPVAAAALKRGMRDVLKSYELRLFSSDELAVILHSGGDTPLDLADWKAHTHYEGYDASSAQILWFWKLLHGLSDGEVRLVLLFATGLTSVPLGGFAELRSLGNSAPGFRIIRTTVGDPNCPDLPRASTCFNQLTLPAYDKEKTLCMKLMTAVRLGSKGFEFA
ncbi:ubiquitin-protein ligase, putative [Perkinsus marinus ATCC 50983]|uniref:E3 ubiquitin-protein ligase HACE1 n=1 Tax=Perkinsus marinus (strain ATCC 50983 / TXsc) TaxID=423536 RepID=C5LF58_PERM5|nr:ubiquitin-protein ligase, putative [Perkinsus marinus ATCC 50983]EER04642.1 ubiquitin-protein ligase, putative [Perkinsus marinus ATCC 50983]|eukprot:XP_002772826.1 ubiquitin-protein ligase, putative [Perkinsus marinus ATCC 50983]